MNCFFDSFMWLGFKVDINFVVRNIDRKRENFSGGGEFFCLPEKNKEQKEKFYHTNFYEDLFTIITKNLEEGHRIFLFTLIEV